MCHVNSVFYAFVFTYLGATAVVYDRKSFDPEHLLVWTYHPWHDMRFYLVNERTGAFQAVAPDVLTHNGHCSYVRGNRWILTDTSPDKERKQHVYLFDTATSRRVE